MRVAYFDCFSGISGDMSLGALIACGVDPDALRRALARLRLPGWKLESKEVSRNGIGAVDVTIHQEEEQGHGRHLSDIAAILDGSDLSARVRQRAFAVFTKLAEAEAKIHQTTPDRIHFHEVGAIDAIMDIVGVCIGIEMLEIDKIICSPLPMGHGFVECMHGIIPIPAPATQEILAGVPVYSVDIRGELVTPTGAALMATLASEFGRAPSMTLERTGYGAGKKQFGETPNLLRVTLGQADTSTADSTEEVVVIETNLDDLSPQFFEHTMARLLGAGALDVYLTPVQMKKGRPGTLLTIVAAPDNVERLTGITFAETSTLGVRFHIMRRLCQEREIRTVETDYGTIRVKVASWNGAVTNYAPEYEDLRAAAQQFNVPVKTIHQAAIRAMDL